MPPKPKEERFWLWEAVAHRWATLGIAFFVAVLGAFPLYWSYNCRHYGQICERSFSEPSRDTLNSNTETVGRLVQTAVKQEIQGFELAPRKSWFRSPRIDVSVRWKDQDALVIDSLHVADLEAASLLSSPDDRTAIVSYGSEETILGEYKRANAHIIFYEISTRLSKRGFDIECIEKIFLKPSLSARNFAYDKLANVVAFDVVSSCSSVAVNGRRTFELAPSGSGEARYFAKRGDTIVLELDANFHARKITTVGEMKSEQERKERDAKLESDLSKCLSALNGKANNESRMELCNAYSENIGASGGYANRIYEGTPGKFLLVREFRCQNDAEEVDAKGSFVIIACWATHRDYKDKAESWSAYQVNVFAQGWGRPLEFSVRCDCVELDVRNFSLNLPNNEVVFELLTTADKIAVQDRPVQITRNTELSAKEKSMAMMRIRYGSDYKYTQHEIASRIQ